MPWQLGPLIYQYGMHPYINIFLSLSVGSIIILKWLIYPNHFFTQSRFFRFGVVLTSLYLLLISFLQSAFVYSMESLFLQMAAAILSIFTILLFGRVIPTSIEPERFLKYIKNIVVPLLWISLLALFISPESAFKGSRFIGIFKHIPHMVSAATVGCFALLYFFVKQNESKKRLIINGVNFSLAFSLLILTGTRSALASVALGVILVAIVFPAKKTGTKILKVAFVITFCLGTLFFGDDAGQYAIEVVRGEKAIGGRVAQDGVTSRLEEFERGYLIFQKDQWLGQGLLSKFSNGSEAEVDSYDAGKDPHNIFISAGVIGGWGLIVLTSAMLVALVVASLKKLRSANDAIKVLAIYTLSQIPILIIYHLHLSLGGIADRIYWIVFGYMALKESDLDKD